MEVILVLIHPWQGQRKGWINSFLLFLPQANKDHETGHRNIDITAIKDRLS
jgi:hypothetical protein